MANFFSLHINFIIINFRYVFFCYIFEYDFCPICSVLFFNPTYHPYAVLCQFSINIVVFSIFDSSLQFRLFFPSLLTIFLIPYSMLDFMPFKCNDIIILLFLLFLTTLFKMLSILIIHLFQFLHSLFFKFS